MHLADRVAEHVLGIIRSNNMKPGDRLPTVEQMAERFSVGHTTVREALNRLEVTGAVEVRQGAEVYVQEGTLLCPNPMYAGRITKKFLLDLLETCVQTETRAIRLAAERAGEHDLQRMETLLAGAEKWVGDEARLREANRAFHRAIAQASGNAILAQLQDALSRLFQQQQQAILEGYCSPDQDHREHAGLLGAIRARDASLAEERMADHLSGVRHALLQWDDRPTLLA